MANKNQRCPYFRKNGGFDVYKWCPSPNNYDKSLNTGGLTNKNKPNPYFCTASSGSQGIDFTNTYIYNNIVINNEASRLAYIECDYVS